MLSSLTGMLLGTALCTSRRRGWDLVHAWTAGDGYVLASAAGRLGNTRESLSSLERVDV